MSKKVNLLIFSADYDKALAAFVIANGALDLGYDVSIFFAFWGLLLVQDPERGDPEGKNLYERMLSMMTPKDPEALPLSRMNMGGFGRQMLKAMMKENEASFLSEYLAKIREKRARFFGCQMSVEVMGFKKEELLPEVEIVDVKEYLKDAIDSDIQLFI